MRPISVLFVSTFLLLSTALTAYATCGTDYWQGNVNPYWDYGPNWSLGFVPMACDAVVIPDPKNASLLNVVANVNHVQGKLYPMDSLQIGNNGNGGSLTINPGAQFQIANDLVVGATGSLANNASVQVGGTGYVDFNTSSVSSTGNFLFQNDLYNQGLISVGGTFTVNNDLYNQGRIAVAGGALTVNGVIHNTGTLNTGVAGMIATPQLENGGMLQIGPGGPGTVSVGTGTSRNTGYVQYANGILDEVITSPNSFGQIFTNFATLDGTLNIELANGFNPPIGTIYQLMSPYELTGSFATVENQYFNNGTEKWDVLYGFNSTFGQYYVDVEAAAAAPEPFSLLLLGTGVMFCYRAKTRRNRRQRSGPGIFMGGAIHRC